MGRARTIGTVAFAVMALVGCSSATSGTGASAGPSTLPGGVADPAAIDVFVSKLFSMRANDQQGPAWDLLVPQQQALVERVKFLDCGSSSTQLTDVSTKVLDEPYPEQIDIPGTEGLYPSMAATVQVTGTVGDETRTQTTTIHLIDVDGQWRWILGPETIAECRAS